MHPGVSSSLRRIRFQPSETRAEISSSDVERFFEGMSRNVESGCFVLSVEFCHSLRAFLCRESCLAGKILRDPMLIGALCAVDLGDQVLCAECLDLVRGLLEMDDSDAIPFDLIGEFVSGTVCNYDGDVGMMTSAVLVWNAMAGRTTVIPDDLVPKIIHLFQIHRCDDDSESKYMFMLGELPETDVHNRFLLYLAVIEAFETYLCNIANGDYAEVVVDNLFELSLSACHEVSVRALAALVGAAGCHPEVFHSRFHIWEAGDKLACRLDTFKRRENTEGVQILLQLFSMITKLNTENENMTLLANRNILPNVLIELIDVNGPEFFLPCCDILNAFVAGIPRYANVIVSNELVHLVLSKYNPHMDTECKTATARLFSELILAVSKSHIPDICRHLEILRDFPDFLRIGTDTDFEKFISCLARISRHQTDNPNLEQFFQHLRTIDFDDIISADRRTLTDACKRSLRKLQHHLHVIQCDA